MCSKYPSPLLSSEDQTQMRISLLGCQQFRESSCFPYPAAYLPRQGLTSMIARPVDPLLPVKCKACPPFLAPRQPPNPPNRRQQWWLGIQPNFFHGNMPRQAEDCRKVLHGGSSSQKLSAAVAKLNRRQGSSKTSIVAKVTYERKANVLQNMRWLLLCPPRSTIMMFLLFTSFSRSHGRYNNTCQVKNYSSILRTYIHGIRYFL